LDIHWLPLLPYSEAKTLNEPHPEPVEDSWATLEKTYLEAYLREKGYSLHNIHQLSEAEARRLMTEASTYASTKLAEVENRSHLVQELQGPTSSR
jgi:hypothetical protein